MAAKHTSEHMWLDAGTSIFGSSDGNPNNWQQWWDTLSKKRSLPRKMDVVKKPRLVKNNKQVDETCGVPGSKRSWSILLWLRFWRTLNYIIVYIENRKKKIRIQFIPVICCRYPSHVQQIQKGKDFSQRWDQERQINDDTIRGFIF